MNHSTPVIKQKHFPFALKAPAIKVEFLVLHYTAASLTDTIKIFQQNQIYSHLIIDVDGTIFETAPCLSKATDCKKAFHAGQSFWKQGNKTWQDFNRFSLGVELVNFNGNVFPFSQHQYQALADLMKIIKPLYPTLLDPNRIVGHEHIAGHRGKADPGLLFHWGRFFDLCHPEYTRPYPTRPPRLTSQNIKGFQAAYLKKIPSKPDPSFPWAKFNLDLELKTKSSD